MPVFNVDSQRLESDSSGSIHLVYATRPVINLEFVDNLGENIDLSDAVEWRAAVDRDFSTASAPMCRASSANIDSTNAATGIIKIKLNTTTAEFLEAVDDRESIQAYFELRGLDSEGYTIHCFVFAITAKMGIDPAITDPPAVTESPYAPVSLTVLWNGITDAITAKGVIVSESAVIADTPQLITSIDNAATTPQIAAIGSAIAAKGVEVPENANASAMPQLIAEIASVGTTINYTPLNLNTASAVNSVEIIGDENCFYMKMTDSNGCGGILLLENSFSYYTDGKNGIAFVDAACYGEDGNACSYYSEINMAANYITEPLKASVIAGTHVAAVGLKYNYGTWETTGYYTELPVSTWHKISHNLDENNSSGNSFYWQVDDYVFSSSVHTQGYINIAEYIQGNRLEIQSFPFDAHTPFEFKQFKNSRKKAFNLESGAQVQGVIYVSASNVPFVNGNYYPLDWEVSTKTYVNENGEYFIRKISGTWYITPGTTATGAKYSCTSADPVTDAQWTALTASDFIPQFEYTYGEK